MNRGVWWINSGVPFGGTGEKSHGAVAQLVAHLHGMEGVRGSSPLSSTRIESPSRVTREGLRRVRVVPGQTALW